MSGVSPLPMIMGFHGVRLDKYLRFVDEDGESHGFFQLSGDELVSPYTRFAYDRPQAAASGDFIHIKSTYNNKYMVRSSQTENWIVGTDEPEDDRSKWSCTLFRPVASGFNNRYRFMHVQSGGYLATNSSVRPNHLHVQSVSLQNAENFTIIDMDSFVVLPRHVTFKGYNDLYLSSRVIERFNYHQFASDDIHDPTIRFEAFTTRDGSVRIWSNHFKRFWRRSPDWIWADSTGATTPDTLFWPIKLDGDVIALRNLGNSRICIARTAERKTDCLNAQVHDIDRLGRIQMEEVVSRRQIYDVTYRTEDARIYNFSSGNSMTREINNGSFSHAQNETVGFTFTRTVTNSWDIAHAWSIEVETTIQTGIPFFAEGQIKIGLSYSGDLSWGEVKEESFETSSSLALEVPPRTRAVVTRIVTRGNIDVPFSYTQQDTLLSGEIVIRRFHDGIFTGQNTYLDYTTRQEPL